MELNLDMDKKLNLKVTQVQYPEVKILADKAKRKATFEVTCTWTDTAAHMGSELPSGTAAKRVRHQRQYTKGGQVEKYHGRK